MTIPSCLGQKPRGYFFMFFFPWAYPHSMCQQVCLQNRSSVCPFSHHSSNHHLLLLEWLQWPSPSYNLFSIQSQSYPFNRDHILSVPKPYGNLPSLLEQNPDSLPYKALHGLVSGYWCCLISYHFPLTYWPSYSSVPSSSPPQGLYLSSSLSAMLFPHSSTWLTYSYCSRLTYQLLTCQLLTCQLLRVAFPEYFT